jgi:signal peptidase II
MDEAVNMRQGMASQYRLLALVTLLVVGLDQAAKHWVLTNMHLGESWPVIDGLLNLTHVHNRGVAFGLFASHGIKASLFVVVSLAALGLIVYFMSQIGVRERFLTLALSAIFAGALGNIIDRLRLGVVVDFVDLHLLGHHWPAFNVADAAITVGGLLLALNLIQRQH